MILLRKWHLFQSRSRPLQDDALRLLFTFVSAGGIIILFALFAFLLIHSYDLVSEISVSDVFLQEWYPLDSEFGLWPMILGSLFISLGSLVLVVPVSVFMSLMFLLLKRGRLSTLIESVLEVANSIPSVVYGFLGLQIIVPALAKLHAPGVSLLAGVFTLSVMIIPFSTLSFIGLFRENSNRFKLISKSLGLSEWAHLLKVVIPASFKSIVSISLLQFMRAVGETMVVLMVCGNIPQIPDSVFAPVRTLTANIALEMAYADGMHRNALYFSGLLIVTVCLICTFIAAKLERVRHEV